MKIYKKTADGAAVNGKLGAYGKVGATHRSSPTKRVHIVAASAVHVTKKALSFATFLFALEKKSRFKNVN